MGPVVNNGRAETGAHQGAAAAGRSAVGAHPRPPVLGGRHSSSPQRQFIERPVMGGYGWSMNFGTSQGSVAVEYGLVL